MYHLSGLQVKQEVTIVGFMVFITWVHADKRKKIIVCADTVQVNSFLVYHAYIK